VHNHEFMQVIGYLCLWLHAMQIIQVTHSALSSQLSGLLYEVDITFCVDANTRFREIYENHATCISKNGGHESCFVFC